MDNTILSSRLTTPWVKRVNPAVLLIIFIIVAGQNLSPWPSLAKVLAFAFVFGIGCVWFWFVAFHLADEVAFSLKGDFEIRRGGRTQSIPVTAITGYSYSEYSRPLIIKLVFSRSTEFGDSISFIPRTGRFSAKVEDDVERVLSKIPEIPNRNRS